MIKKQLLLMLFSIFLTYELHARPEYALKTKVDCSSCHVQSFGGGQRNKDFGKSFALRTWGPGFLPLLPISMDARILMNGRVKNGEPQIDLDKGLRKGVLMSSVISGYANIYSSDTHKVTIAGAYDVGMFIPGARDLYLSYSPVSMSEGITLMAGQFRVPFGLMTDEHRTFSRQLTKTTNRDFTTGLALKTSISDEVFMSGALISTIPGYKYTVREPLEYGIVLDFKWQSLSHPLMLGSSILTYKLKDPLLSNAQASSVYLGLDLGPVTKNFIDGSVLIEAFQAKGFNDSDVNEFITRNFIPSGLTTELRNIRNSASSGVMGQLKIQVHPKLNLVAKYDLASISELSTDYSRIGIGADLAIYHINILFRYDKGLSKGPEFSSNSTNIGSTVATEDMFYIVTHFWL